MTETTPRRDLALAERHRRPGYTRVRTLGKGQMPMMFSDVDLLVLLPPERTGQ